MFGSSGDQGSRIPQFPNWQDDCVGTQTLMQRRRSFVQWMLGGGFSASILSFLYPAFRFLKPPQAAEASVNEAPAGKVGDLKPNTAKIIKFGARPVLVMRDGMEGLFRGVQSS